MREKLCEIGKYCLLLGWIGLITSCMRDDDLDRLASRQTATSRPEIQRPSTAEIEQFISDNRLLSAANGMSYSAINPIWYIKMSNRNAAAGVIRLVRDGKVEQWVFTRNLGN